jgi:hypothetical protein
MTKENTEVITFSKGGSNLDLSEFFWAASDRQVGCGLATPNLQP